MLCEKIASFFSIQHDKARYGKVSKLSMYIVIVTIQKMVYPQQNKAFQSLLDQIKLNLYEDNLVIPHQMVHRFWLLTLLTRMVSNLMVLIYQHHHRFQQRYNVLWLITRLTLKKKNPTEDTDQDETRTSYRKLMCNKLEQYNIDERRVLQP